MRFIKCFVVLCLCFFMVNCPQGHKEFDRGIDIGDYEYHWEAWNSQNMLNYQIEENYFSSGGGRQYNYLIVRNGIPESESSVSTIPELYAWFKDVKSGNSQTYFESFKVGYNTEYHYPDEILITRGGGNTRWQLSVMPLEEGGLDIDIGDYEYHLEAWNSQNMLDYQLEVMTSHGRYNYNSVKIFAAYNIKNGIPDRNIVSFYDDLKEATVLEIYSLVKDEKERIQNAYNGIDRSYLHVQYDTEYHYPTKISLGIGHSFGYYECWEFALAPEETE